MKEDLLTHLQIETRIKELEKMTSRNVSYYFASAWPEVEDEGQIAETEWSDSDAKKRMVAFIKAEIAAERKHLHDIEVRLARKLLREAKS